MLQPLNIHTAEYEDTLQRSLAAEREIDRGRDRRMEESKRAERGGLCMWEADMHAGGWAGICLVRRSRI